MSRLTLIVAATKSNGIGQNGALPWRLPKEMAYFAKATTNAPEGEVNAVLMGRNTWESIPNKFRPLKNRANFILTSDTGYSLGVISKPDNFTQLSSNLENALLEVSKPAAGGKPIQKRFIIGGATLYSKALALPRSSETSFVDRVLLTRIHSPAFADCDVFMPDFLSRDEGKGTEWRRASHEELKDWVGFDVPDGMQEENGVIYEFQMWLR